MRRAAHSALFVHTARRPLDVDLHIAPASPWSATPPIHALQDPFSCWPERFGPRGFLGTRLPG
eukprot:8051778-Pyramimonas_sp.AAC.1